MEIVDHVFILLLLVLQPVYGAIESKRIRADALAGKPLDRAKWYRETAMLEWAFLAVLFTAWYLYGRPLAELGFVEPAGTAFWLGTIFVLLVVGYLVWSHHQVRNMDAEQRAKNIKALGDIEIYLPRTDKELRYFTGVSFTAGVVEEIVYRGFVIWYFSNFMPLWPAVIASSILFGLAHSYQGANGALRCGSLGLGFGALYVLTGSIWLPIIAHILLDVLQGVTLRKLLGEEERLQPEPQ